MELKVDAPTMEAMVAKAMFDSYTQEQRDELVGNALKALLSTPSSQYDKTPAIQRLFREQAETVARKIAMEKMETDASFKANVEGMFADAAKRCFEDVERREAIVDELANAMRKAITGDRY